MSNEDTLQPESQGAPRWRRRLVIALVVLVAASIGARVAFGKVREKPAKEARQSSPDGFSTQLVPGEEPEPGAKEPEAEPTGLEKVLPFVTEGGIAALLGLFLGMATRMIAKLFMLLALLFFVGLQFFAHKGWIGPVDWAGMAEWMRDFVLNVSSESGIGSIVQHKLPSLGSFGLGYLLGLKKG